MFKLRKEIDVWWPVVIPVPSDGGTFAKHKIECQFRIGGKAALEGAIEDETAAMLAAATDGAVQKGDALAERLVGLRGVQDEQGEEIAFSDELRESLLGIPYARSAIFSAYVEACTGRKAIRGN
jgi:hypothetical protein